MEAHGIKISTEELKEIITQLNENSTTIIILFIIYVTWYYRNNIFKFLCNLLRPKQKPLYQKIKCNNCKQKKLVYTNKNISEILRPSTVLILSFDINYEKAGNFFICWNYYIIVD